MTPPSYSPLVWDLFRAPPSAGAPRPAEGWVVGQALEPLSETRVQVYFWPQHGQVVAVRYAVRGCPHTVAAAALLAQSWQADGSLAAARPQPRALLEQLGAPVAKLGRILVVEQAFATAAQHVRAVPT